MSNCPKCGKQVSDQATVCPSCGMSLTPSASGEPPPGAGAAPPSEPRKRGLSTLVIVLIVLAGICLLGGGVIVAILYPVISQAKLSAQRAETLANMKQLAMGTLMYMSEYDDVLPHRFSTNGDLRDMLMPYKSDEKLYETLNPNGGEVVPNENLEGVSAMVIPDFPNTVMIFETEDWPSDRRCYAFADGHAMVAKEEESQHFEFGPFEEFDPLEELIPNFDDSSPDEE